MVTLYLALDRNPEGVQILLLRVLDPFDAVVVILVVIEGNFVGVLFEFVIGFLIERTTEVRYISSYLVVSCLIGSEFRYLVTF